LLRFPQTSIEHQVRERLRDVSTKASWQSSAGQALSRVQPPSGSIGALEAGYGP
jgi:hypothetical protein